jgi:hypothetical protein
MANICSNWVEIRGEEKDIKAFIELVGKKFDFNQVIPTETDSRTEAIEKWGCSSIAFDAILDDTDEESFANWSFWTNWNAPTAIYNALVERFPDLHIYWRYEEPGNCLYGFLQNEEQ